MESELHTTWGQTGRTSLAIGAAMPIDRSVPHELGITVVTTTEVRIHAIYPGVAPPICDCAACRRPAGKWIETILHALCVLVGAIRAGALF